MSQQNLEEFLQGYGINVTKEMIDTLRGFHGIENVSDLSLLNEDELKEIGLTTVQIRKVLRDSKQLSDPLTASMTSSYNMSEYISQRLTPSLSLNYHHSLEPPVRVKPVFQIRYVLCVEIFTRNQEEYCLSIDPQDSMEFLIRQICNIHQLPDVLTLELFNVNGCPLNVNNYTMKMTLEQWRIDNNDSFYAFARRKEQPSWNFPELKDHATDPTKGQSILKILSEVYGSFLINVNLRNLKVETILKKSAIIVGVPSQYLSLYESVESHQELKNVDLKNVKNGDEFILRFKEVHACRYEIGKPSYAPITEQTEKGLVKFYAILKYLTVGRNVSTLNITAAVFKLTNCPPMANALHSLLNFHFISHISYLVALFEGFYNFSRAVLEYFCNIKLEQTFEFFDYVMGFIMNIAETTNSEDQVNFTTISLHCPITCKRIIDPVFVMSQENQVSYERIAAIRKLEGNEILPEADTSDVEVEDLFSNHQLEQYLISFSFSSVKEVSICEAICETKMGIPPLAIPCTWKDLKENIAALNIVSPENVSSRGSLTYITEGHFAVFIEITKSSDIKRTVYDPLTCEFKMYSEEEMDQFVCDLDKVTHNLFDYLKPKVKGLIAQSDLLENSQSDVVQSKKGITREPREAIMVVLDTSSSMNSNIFSESDEYKRITAAKDFFVAFANRTQAYELHHVVGVICFNREIKEVLPLSEVVVSHFKTSLNNAETMISKGTALYDAMKRAADTLCVFASQHPLCSSKRILCLTDGEDFRSKTTPYDLATFLRSRNIVADSVLINPDGNGSLKAICHATGGFCFLPTSRIEGIRIFEMEIFLSIRQRKNVEIPNLSNKAELKKLETNRYDSTDPFSFQSKFFSDLEETTTCSSKRMVLLASFVIDKQSSSSSQKPHVKTIMKEMTNYEKNPHPDVRIFPDESNVCHWKILIKGPPFTPYERGVYLLFAKFPNEYPYKPPEMRFVTPIYHCNINSMGRICHPILGRNYVPSLTIREIFEQVFGLLMSPEPDDPLDSVLADEFHTNKEQYMMKARELNKQRACQITWEDYIKTLSDEETDVAEEVKCPLTGKLYEDPVVTPYGHTYDRSALLRYMQLNNNLDPKAGKPLKVDDLSPSRDLKALADRLRITNLT